MKNLKSCIIIFIILTFTTGIVYPLLITAVGQIFFPWQANGSLIYQNKVAVGSALIGQSFNTRSDLFWSRPSGTPDHPYNATSSGGSNLGPTNPKLISEIENRIAFLNKNGIKLPIPSDLVMGSGSGLDPDITPESAMIQIPRISKVTNIPEDTLKELVIKNTETKDLGLLGANRVNVLKLNLKLLELERKYAR